MQFLRKSLIVLILLLVIMPVGLANNAMFARAKDLPSDVASRLKRAVLRSSAAGKIIAGVATILLTTSAYGDGVGGDNDVPRAATEEIASQVSKKRYDVLSLYFGRGRNYMSESTDAYTTTIDGVEYQRLGDYYGLPTTIDETIDNYIGGLGAHLGDTGVEVKFFFFGGINRVKSGVYLPKPGDVLNRNTGNMPNIIFAGTRQLFGLNANKGLVGIGEQALLTFHLGASFNIHPVTGTITTHIPSETAHYQIKDKDGNTMLDHWEEKGDQHVTDLPVWIGGHLGAGLLWQVNLDLASFYDDVADEGGLGGGLGVSYIGSVTHKGSHTHLVMLRLSFRSGEY